ncbi:MAG: DNA polymerase IV [Firmicutes bacterium ADurb.Bin193]|nr:MAG: DNA polymerase IV [Firmicutes bacterium ADurb.Bin193]
MERVILHSDLNNFYASVECLYKPELRDRPVAVGGDVEARHGIILAKNYHAKKYGIITGEALWQARQKCKDLIVLPPDYKKYLKFSKLARDIYADYTDRVESFGLDENWLDITGSVHLFGDGKKVADEIRERIKFELSITASVGVSFNKIFAKLGSDIKKPDATTVITRENFKEVVWNLPVNELLYVGRSTHKKLRGYGIKTIGDLANTPVKYLEYWLGKWGYMLWTFANGYDTSPVSNIAAKSFIKSIGNSTTAPRDLVSNDDVKITVYVLSESVAARLRLNGFKCNTVQIYVRDNGLESFERQGELEMPTSNSDVIAKKALDLFEKNYNWDKPIRSMGVRACNLVLTGDTQMSFLPEYIKEQKEDALERAVDDIRRRFGHYSIGRGLMLCDSRLSNLNPKDDHVIFPISYL